MFYRKCPDCGANLDPGEVCDCVREKRTDVDAGQTPEDRSSE